MWRNLLNNLAIVVFGMGQVNKAKDYAQRAIEIREALQGKDHPELALALHNLAQALIATGETNAARRTEERSTRRSAWGGALLSRTGSPSRLPSSAPH